MNTLSKQQSKRDGSLSSHMAIPCTIATLFYVLSCSVTACAISDLSAGDYSKQEVTDIRNLLGERCKTEAVEIIRKTISTDSLYLVPTHDDGEYSTVLAVLKGHAGYVAHGQGHLFLFGQIKTLRTVEYDLNSIRREVYGAKYLALQVRSRESGEKRNDLRSRYAVKIQDLTKPEQASLSLVGQQISVLDLQTGEEIAKKKSFFWIDRRPLRNGVVYDFCPKDATEEYSVGDFVKKVMAE
jgi:hypothetical protein